MIRLKCKKFERRTHMIYFAPFTEINGLMKRIYLLHLLALLTFSVSAQTASEIKHNMEKLATGKRILYVAAHPDDENTRLISWLTHAKNAEVAYLSLTRGSGGQNLIGNELGDPLGLIRTQELLAARRKDGARQYFTRARDFGYSKNAAETLEKWNESEILKDVVWVIRHFKPDVIITRFSPVENAQRPTHGHHTASAMLAVKGFAAAADGTMFPEQVKTLGTWQATGILWNTSTWFYGSREKLEETLKAENRAFTRINVEDYVPLIGLSCPEIAALSRSMHKSQGFGSSPAFGEQFEYLEWLDGDKNIEQFPDNIAGSYQLNSNTKKLQSEWQKIIKNFNDAEPWKSVPDLLLLKTHIEQLPPNNFRTDLELLDKIILACMGVSIRMNAAKAYAARNDSAAVTVLVRNPSDMAIEKIDLEIPGYSTKTMGKVAPHSFSQQSHAWLVADNAALSEPYWLQMEHGETEYNLPDGLETGETVVMPGVNSVFCTFTIGSNKVKYTEPIVYRYNDPVIGEVEKPMGILPRASLRFNHPVYTASPGRQIVLSVTPYTEIKTGFVELEVPAGWQVNPPFYKVENLKKDQVYTYTYQLTATTGAATGDARAMLKESLLISTATVNTINYPHIPYGYYMEHATAKLIGESIICKSKRIAYISGAGDETADALDQLCTEVYRVPANALLSTDYQPFQAVVLGVRAYNTIENINPLLEKLYAYAAQGGLVIVQYNTTANLKTTGNGPLPFTLGRGRVTKEDAAVGFTDANMPVLNQPNKLIPSDFNGWVQERGLYFAQTWDPAYQTPLVMNDPGESPEKGSLLILPYKKGYFVYTGLSFFRQLPAGVPGAYRLFANLLSLGR